MALDGFEHLMQIPRREPHATAPPPGPGGRASSRRLRRAAIGALIVIIGVASSAFLADRWRASAVDANKSAFTSTATDLSRTLEAKLAANIALVRTIRSIATMEPSAGQARFEQWYRQLQLGAPAFTGSGAEYIQPVPAARLGAFRRYAKTDPAFRGLLLGDFQIVPPGKRPVYCLARAIVGPAGASNLYPPLLDYCAPVLPGIGRSPFAALFRAAASGGSTVVTPIPGFSLVALGEGVYRRGAPLQTTGQRRAAFTGVIGTSFDSAALLRSLLGDHHALRLSLYHRNLASPLLLIGRAGATQRAPSGYSQRRDFGQGWVLQTSGTVDSSIAADTQGLVVLGTGLLLTLLCFLTYRVLATSRRRAWGLVGEKTGELAYRALHDPLTDLPNRALVLDRAEQILARARRLDVRVTALFVDIDDFKQINDRFGHHVGDEVLRQVGARLKTILRDNDTVGRLSGDEFVMLIDSIGLNASPELVAERILDVLRAPFELLDTNQASVLITASIGIATGLPASAEDLMQDADLALHKAKTGGKNSFALFETAMQTAAQDRMKLEVDLADALDGEQLYLVYQPMLDLASERVIGVEALLRWRHPQNGVIPPDAFIPLAEENGLIVPIGRWVLEQGCAQGAAWQREGHELTVAINVSARQLERLEFVAEVSSALRISGLEPARLTLEITETVLMRKPDFTASLLNELKALGVRIAVDDFGTGYSSLAYLRQFPVDSLKIDRTFITNFARSSEAHALTHTLIQLGKALGLETLAEGVEEHDQVRELQLEGCDLAQGFLFSRPLSPEALVHFLEERAGAASGWMKQRSPALH
jgi:diguanylate cyclase (GGDEF)-like protein